MATKKKDTPAETLAETRQYPAVEEFTDELLKELRAEFEKLVASKANPERLEMLRELGKKAQAFLKAKKAGAATHPSAPATKKFVMTDGERAVLTAQMNEVMTLVPPLDPAADDVDARIIAELADLHLSDFVTDADHPEKKIFDDVAKALIRSLGVKIPGEDPAEKKPVKKPVGKKEFPSARQVIYKAWMAGEKDVDKLAALVNESVKKDTIRTYLSDWSKGKYLPAGVTAPVIKDGKAVTKSAKK